MPSSANDKTVAPPPARAIASRSPAEIEPKSMPSVARPSRIPPIAGVLPSVWLGGCFFFGLQLLVAARVLRRRLSACRPVTDVAVLTVLEAACQRIGLRRTPDLLVTPESISPYIVGTWKPKIVVPEAIVTESSNTWLRHAMAHELAHLVRGDLWTNWLLLMARALHWFNPLAWWSIREMQAEREAACDELAIAALGEADRAAYASTIIELAASLAPAGMAPAMIGLIASARRLKTRVERIERSPSTISLRAPFAIGIVLGLALLGLTDAMPAATNNPSPALTEPAPERAEDPEVKTVTLRGNCIDQVDRSAIAGATVRLFKAQGRTSPIVEIAKSVSDREGRFEFPLLTPPRPTIRSIR